MKVKYATDVGRVRTVNEDYLWANSRCLVVCDGMGGHLAGEVASKLAVQTIKSFPFTGADPITEVRKAIEQAQEAILTASQTEEKYRGMGTTVTLAWIDKLATGEAEITIGHVGDSRGYIFSCGVLEQLTSDHSMVAELLRHGSITQAEARNHRKKHVLTQALGSNDIKIELKTRKLPAGSMILLCSDGLTDVVTDEQISEVLKSGQQTKDVAQALVDLANELGGPDNVSVIVAQV